MIQLKVKNREKGLSLKKVRKEGMIPAIVYSKGQIGLSLFIDYVKFAKAYEDAGESSLIDLVFDDGQSKKVLIHEVQYEPVKDRILHIDFYEVDLAKKVTAPVELEFVGEAPVVKNEGGIVIKQLNEIEIECLPADLIKRFKVDISCLTDFSSTIHIKDLVISDKITILNNPDDVVVNVTEPRAAEEETPAAEGEGAGEEAKE
ncbi:50S ribosomal protein L25, partial [Candidatus Falkowbacteria bacterium CG10_big_fil_rev_8_21_14_0_10_43_10]